MKFYKFFCRTVLLCVVFCNSLTTVAAKDEWLKIRSKNFRLVGNASEKDIRGVAIRLEQFRESFRQFFTEVNFNAAVPVNVVVFKSDESLPNFRPLNEDGKKTDSAAGYFQSGDAANYIALSVNDKKTPDYRQIFHEYVHSLINDKLGRSNIQPWFNEGLAEYYETFQIENDRQATLGGWREDHLLLLRESKLIPFEAFFETDYYSLRRQGNHGAGIFYAQAWALTHYLMHADSGARTSQLNKYTQLVLSGKSHRYAFTEAFQTDYQAMERELKKYIEQKNLRAPVAVASLKDKSAFDSEIQSASATEAEAKIVLGDLLYQSDRLAEAATMLEGALKLDGDSSLANSLLALVKMKQGKSEEAVRYAEKAISLDNKDYLAHYRRAYILSREGMTDYGFVSNYTLARAAQIRESLDEAIRLNPNFPESYQLYAFVNCVRSEAIDRAIEYLERALEFAPGDQWNQMRAAELAMRKEDFGKARNIARKIYETAPDDRLRVYAKNTIYRIDSFESQLESLRNPHRRRLYDVTDKPLTEEESARLNWLAMQEAINRSLRRAKSDEKRVLGYLTQIECGASGIEFSIKTGDQNLKLSSETFETLTLISYIADESGGQIGCGTRKKNAFAVIVYRPFANADKSKSAGEIVSIEFVPEKFKFF
jgi:tetratricopeptide (TPR) repeat protein